MTTPFISIDRIAVRLRDRWLLDGFSWQINTGEVWMVNGPNGAGKTTLAKAIAGILPIVQGKIHYHAFEGRSPLDAIAYVASDARRKIWRRERELDHGRCFAGRFNAVTTVRDLIGRHPADRPFPPELDVRLAAVVRRFNLRPLLEKSVLAISTGEMSRVLIARGLIRRPKMLILDEPFEGLDVSGRRQLTVVLNGLVVSGLPILLITHRPEEMIAATTHVLTLDAGRRVNRRAVEAAPEPFFSAAEVPTPKRQRTRPELPAVSGEADRRLAFQPLIDMNAVTVRYGSTIVLDRFSWVVKKGERWAVTGPSGAGKSTILKLITGECLQVYANRIRLFGKDRGAGQTLWEIRERLGVVSNDLAVGYQKQMSALDVVCSGFFDSVGLFRRCDPGQIETAYGWLAKMDASALCRTPFNQLSQGERQMILIARAMVKLPMLLILDEPCAGLDPENRRRVLDLVARIGRSGVTGLIFVSHHENEIPACMTHRLALNHGMVVHSGAIEEK